MTETTTTAMLSPTPLKRCAILGTAETLRMCPWGDTTLEVWALNDAYMLQIPRADRWYDLHPFHQMFFRSATPGGPGSSGSQAEVPLGVYLRPEGHLHWLQTRGFPVYLSEARKDYPTSRPFPKQAVLDFWAPYWPLRLSRRGVIQPGPDYEVSTPAWMLMHAVAEGYTEIHIYGIHLATEWEYTVQRPNFEFLMGVAAGRGVRFVVPEPAPICKADYQYAFAPKADLPKQQLERDIARIKQEGMTLRQQYAAAPWYARSARTDLTVRLQHLDAVLADTRMAMDRHRALALAV